MQARLEHGAVLEATEAASHGPYRKHALVGEGVVAVRPGLARAPPRVRNHWNPAEGGTVLYRTHLVELIALDGLGKVGINAEVHTENAPKRRAIPKKRFQFFQIPPRLPSNFRSSM